MFWNGKGRRKFGVFLLFLGVVSALIFHHIKGLNQPVKVISSLGSGYMTDGWGDALPMFDLFIGLGIVLSIIGLFMIVLKRNDE